MAHRIICISRACGSGGKVIGQKVASKLGIGFYDSNLLDMAKEHGGISSTSLDKADEKATNPFYFKPLYEGNENVEKERPATETLFQLQSAVIRQIASDEDCVIVGRCADFVLEEHPDAQVLSVFVTSPMAHRIERLQEVQKASVPQAKAFIRKTDTQRKNYYNYFTKREWGHSHTYDILLNSHRLGLDGTADLLCTIYKGM